MLFLKHHDLVCALECVGGDDIRQATELPEGAGHPLTRALLSWQVSSLSLWSQWKEACVWHARPLLSSEGFSLGE